MMVPYYQDEYATLYHGDCREVPIPYGNVDAVCTDPPYGINLKTEFRTQRGNSPSLTSRNDWPLVAGDSKPFDPTWLAFYKQGVIWGGNYFHALLPQSNMWFVWDKEIGEWHGTDCELAYTWGLKGNAVRLFKHRWNGMLKASERDKRRVHPTQKPVALMLWCLSFLPDAETIFDPYCGSGPVLIAAKQLNKKCIGIEIEERYCEIAAQRLSQEVLDFGETGP